MTTSARTAHRAGRLLTGEPGAEITDAAIVLDGDRIDWVGPAAELPSHAPEPIDHGAGATILPGLIDTHVHLAFDGSPHPVDVMMAADDIGRFTIMLSSARELLSAGVTTARDLGAPAPLDIRVKEAIASGRARGPRLLTVNAPITPTGGPRARTGRRWSSRSPAAPDSWVLLRDVARTADPRILPPAWWHPRFHHDGVGCSNVPSATVGTSTHRLPGRLAALGGERDLVHDSDSQSVSALERLALRRSDRRRRCCSTPDADAGLRQVRGRAPVLERELYWPRLESAATVATVAAASNRGVVVVVCR